MSNSPLVSYTQLSPNYSAGRQGNAIDWFIPHCVVGQCSVESLGNIFAPTSRQASSNYGIGADGRIAMYVEEKNRSWCTSSRYADNRGITIECASDAYAPYAFKNVVYQSLINLAVDCCKRNGKTKIIWFGDRNKTLNYTPAKNEMVIAVHRWFENKSCPGDWLYNRLGDFAKAVNAKLGGDVTGIDYQAHCQSYGWMPWVANGETAGTTGQSKRLEALKVKIVNMAGNVWVTPHVQSIGWMDPVKGGAVAGSEGKGLALQAVKIKVTGDVGKVYDVYYRMYVQTYGWLDWAKNGEIAGTVGMSKRGEAIQIKLVKKGEPAPGPTDKPSIVK